MAQNTTRGQCYKTFYGCKLRKPTLEWSTLPANIRLDWKGLAGTNALAYYENS
jgi:hypothetical protein